MSLYTRLKLRRHDFLTDTSGSVPTEGVLASVFLIWWYIASFQFFDAFRQKNVNLKAAYTIADMISREGEIDGNYVEGLNTLFDYLTFSRRPTWVRATSVIWDDDDNRFEVAWSYASGSTPGETTSGIQAKTSKIPVMPASDSVIVVETNMAYEPIFSIGLNAHWYTTFIATRPRFASCVRFNLHDGTEPACTYDADIDMSDNDHDDGSPTTTDDTEDPIGGT